jgi:hypothetical protein
VGAFEQTKCRRSVVSDTYQSLSEQAKRWREKIDLLESGQRLDREQTIADLGKLLDTCQNLRDAILSEDGGATWKTTTELKSLVERLDEIAEKRSRYLDLAQWLGAGTIEHRRERTKQERLRQRDAAVAELMEISAMAAPPELPGPAVEEWLNWACSLDDSTNDPDLAKLKAHFPRVDDFVRQLDIETWREGKVSVAERVVGVIPEIRAKVSAPPAIQETIQEAVKDTETDTEPVRPVIEEPIRNSIGETIEEVETGTAPFEFGAMETVEEEEGAEASPVPASVLEESAPKRPVESVEGEGKKLAFFDQDELENFARYIEEAKTEPKIARSVRSLLAISQWLLPSDQNPVLHATWGIRSVLGYKGSSDLLPVSPTEAARAIETENGLLLLTGGADLLRWSIAQRAEGHFDGIASIRRLTMEQIRGWFSEVYKIELAEPQVLDVYKLTSGIPLLLGELHRLILPNPKTPPTWLGYAIWTNVKTSFERRLPVLARELRNGSPAVRLTEQEIRLLKMVSIASDDSTTETISSNLRENWDKYRRPEIQAMTAKDEPRVRLLQTLGLLPMRAGHGLGPMQAILPVGPDDALRQIVSYL